MAARKKKEPIYDVILDEQNEVVGHEIVDWKFDPGPMFEAPPLPLMSAFGDPVADKPKPKPRDDLGSVQRLFSQRHQQISRWAVGTPKELRQYPAEICHAQLRVIPKDCNLFASNFDVLPDMVEVGEEFWQFMTGQGSPYRCLFEHGVPSKLFFDDGCQSGFTMNTKDIVDKKKTSLVYNFCIAMRMIHEYPKTIKAWSVLRKHGLDGIEAFYLARMYPPHHIDPEIVVKHQMNDGCHWPFWFVGTEYNYEEGTYVHKGRYINFDRLYDGNPTFDGRSCNQWCDKPEKRNDLKDFSTKVPTVDASKGRFSKIKGHPIDAVCLEFKEWMTDYRNKMRGEVK